VSVGVFEVASGWGLLGVEGKVLFALSKDLIAPAAKYFAGKGTGVGFSGICSFVSL
jgi:hypothetical protein